MFHTERSWRNRSPSLHQKQMRFFIWLFLVLVTLLAILIFWLINRLGAPV